VSSSSSRRRPRRRLFPYPPLFRSRVTAGDERDSFLVVHGHAAEGVANIAGGSDGIGVAVGAFRIDVDQAHLHGRERVFEIAVTRSEEHTSELQSRENLVCRLLLEK